MNMQHQNFIEKYRPNNLKEIVGQEKAIQEAELFLKNFPKKKAGNTNATTNSKKKTQTSSQTTLNSQPSSNKHLLPSTLYSQQNGYAEKYRESLTIQKKN